MRRLNIFLLFFCLALHSYGENSTSVNSIFTEANTTYRRGNYEAAAVLYESILNKGLKSGELYYNLGNCYFKTGETPKAILAYERARKFMPEDEDLAYNLRLSYSNTIDKIEPVPQLFYERWWAQLLHVFRPSHWAVLAVIILWLAAGLAGWYLYAGSIRARKYTFLGSGSLLALALFFFLFARSSHKQINLNDAAIVMEPTTIIRSSPDNRSTSLFMLHAGTKIEVVDELGGWKQIRIANGNSGWIKEEAIDLI
jgi:tetratricopeptide (TPR) repeat protein